MEPYEQEQWNQLGQGLAAAEKKLLATAKLVKGGIPMVVSQQMRIDALIDSDARLYLQMQQLVESQQRMLCLIGFARSRLGLQPRRKLGKF